MARLVLSAAAAYVGYQIGGATGARIAFAATYAATGAYQASQQRIDGPRLSDAQLVTASYGEPIPYGIATNRVAGQVLWESPRRDITTDSRQGKGGGPTLTTHSYERDVLFQLMSNTAEAVTRIWSNGKLVWTTLTGASDASLSASDGTDLWESLTFYGGSATQMPDPTYEAIVGSGNAPAYRDRTSVMIKGLKLGTSGQLPNLTFEVARSVTASGSGFVAQNPASITGDTVFATSGAFAFGPAYFRTPSTRTGLYYYELALTGEPRGWYIGMLARTQWETSLSRYPGNPLGTTGGFWAITNTNYGGSSIGRYEDGNNIGDGSMDFNSSSSVVGVAFDYDTAELRIWVNGSLKWTVTLPDSDFDPYWTVYARFFLSYGATIRRFPSEWQYAPASAASWPTATYAPGTATLQSVVEELCERSGMPSGTYDASALSTITRPVRSLLIGQVGSTRGTLAMLLNAYYATATLADKIYFRPLATTSSVTIPLDDLAAGVDTAEAEPLPITQATDLELPAQVAIRYRNISDDYQDGTELSDRLLSSQVAIATEEVALGMTPSEAKALADARVVDNVAALTTASLSLPMKYSALEPGDVVQVDGLVWRLGRRNDSSGVIQFEARRHDASAIVSSGLTDDDYTSSTEVVIASSTVWLPLDMPLARGADDGPGYYIAAKGSGTYWPGTSIQSSIDNTTFTEVVQIPSRAPLGVTTTTLAAFSGVGVDETNTVSVNLGSETLSSSTRSAMEADESINTMLIGSEVVRFVTATLASSTPNIYTLKRLTRGHRGTEWAMSGHTTGEACVLISNSGVRHVSTSQSDVNAVRYIKGVTLGAPLSSATAASFTNTGRNQKPYAVTNLRAASDSSSVTLTWDRRSRIPSSMFRGSVLAEESESYDVEIRDGSDVLQQSETVSSPSYIASSYVPGDFILAQIWGIRSVSGNLLAVHDPQAKATGYGGKRIVAVTAGGDFTDYTSELGEQIHQWTNSGDAVYAAVSSINAAAVPAYYTASKIVKATRGTLASLDATVTAATPGDYAGIAHDGTDVWVSERISGNLRRLNSSSLASIASYAVAGTPTALAHNSGKVWALCEDSKELVKFDTTSHTEDARISLGARPFDIRIASGKVYVSCDSSLQVFDESAATLTASYAYGAISTGAQRSLSTLGSYVVADCLISGVRRLVLLTASTGAVYRVLGIPVASFYFCAGEFGSDLYLTIAVTPASSLQTRKYTLAPPNLTGYTATVWQRSAAVGRGYPTTLAL